MENRRRDRRRNKRGRQLVSTSERIDARIIAAAFGRVLRETRVRRAVSQLMLADSSGLDPTYPSMLERGLRNPGLPIIIAVAEALAVNADALVARTVELVRHEGKLPPPRLPHGYK